MKDLWTFFTAQEIPSILADGTPIFIWVIIFAAAISSNPCRPVHETSDWGLSIILILQMQKLRIIEAQDLPLQERRILDSSPFP